MSISLATEASELPSLPITQAWQTLRWHNGRVTRGQNHNERC